MTPTILRLNAIKHGQGSLVAFVLSLNLHRRHLDESQRAMVGAKAKGMFEDEARQRQATSIGGSNPQLVANLPEAEAGRARDKAAASVNVSPRSVESASKVIASGSPELIAAVDQGKVSVSAASAIAELPKPEQVQVLTAGQKEVIARASEIRAAKKQKPATKGPVIKRPSPEDLLSARVLELVGLYERETGFAVLSLSVVREGAAAT